MPIYASQDPGLGRFMPVLVSRDPGIREVYACFSLSEPVGLGGLCLF